LGVLLKIAGGTPGNFSPIGQEEFRTFKSYINRIKPAGVFVEVWNLEADKLQLEISIQYNPLVLDSKGKRISDDTYPVKEAIQNYLQSILFNREFVKMKLVDAIQAVEGVEIVENTNATILITEENEEKIFMKYKPRSGYMALDIKSDLIINYFTD
jgi:hypothetical protein